MKIYTGYGDQGRTMLFGGENVPKTHPRVEAYGTLDELNSQIGLLRSMEPDERTAKVLHRIQTDIFAASSEIATPDEKRRQALPGLIQEAHIKDIENLIDELDNSLAPLKNFILPGGTPRSAQCHVVRSISRRAERQILRFAETDTCRPELLIYFNRLSDFFFVLARYFNKTEGRTDTAWNPKSNNLAE